jgi:hypothetical protein
MTEKNKKLDKKLQEKINKAGRSGPPFNPVIKKTKPPKPVAKPKPPSRPNTNTNYKAEPFVPRYTNIRPNKAPPSKTPPPNYKAPPPNYKAPPPNYKAPPSK